jgi:uncharacterized protein YkwD
MVKGFLKKKYTNIAIVLFVVFLISGMFFSPTYKKVFQVVYSKISQFATVLSSALVLQTNSFRATNNETSLIVNDLLTTAAQMKADDMATKGYFSHTGPQGEEPWVWFDRVGYKYNYAGENLAVDYTESNDVTDGWINSAKHKANLLNKNFTEMGIGVADGTFEGHKTTFVVQFFAKPLADNEIVQKQEVSPITKLLSLIKAETPVSTKVGVSKGEVLGVESINMNWNDQKTLTVLGIIALIILVVFIFRKKHE